MRTDLAKNIREIRVRKGLKQQVIAEHLGLSINGYSKMERGETKIPAERLIELCEALQTDLNSIFGIYTSTGSSISKRSDIELLELYRQRIDDLTRLLEAKEEIIRLLRRQ